MKQLLASIAAVSVALGAPASASAQPSIEGRWANPKRNVIVEVERCGPAYCGTVSSANPKAKQVARKAGTSSLVGTRVLTGLKRQGNGVYKGRVFDPKRNLRVPATVRPVGPNTLMIEGCAIPGVLCKEQRWTRVGG